MSDVIDQPTFKEIYKDIENFIDNNILVAHFSQFDMYALQDVYSKYSLDIPPYNYVCSYRIAKSLFDLPSYRLKSLAKEFDIKLNNHHHALADAKASGDLLFSMLENKSIDLNTFMEEHKYSFGTLGNKGFKKKRDYKNKKIELNIDESKFDQDHEFYQKHICFTGALQRLTRAEAAQTITDIGAIFNKGITLKTNYLVVGNLENLEKSSGMKKSSKILKVEKLAEEGREIEVLSEHDFYKLL